LARSRLDSKRRALHTGEYEKTAGGYEYRWREKIGEKKGRAVYKQRSITARSLDELRQMEQQLSRDKAEGILSASTVTLNQYVDKWFKTKHSLKENTKNNYLYMYTKFVRHSRIGKMPLQKMKKSDLLAFYAELIEQGSLSVSTCATLQSVIVPTLELAVDDDIIRRNIAREALKELSKKASNDTKSAVIAGAHKPESLTVAEQKRFLQVIKDTQWELPMRVLMEMGLRVGELSALTWQDVNLDTRVMDINKTLVYYKKSDGHCGMAIHYGTKTDAGCRTLIIPKQLISLFKKQKQASGKLSDTVFVDGVNGFIFITREQTPHRQDTINRALKRIIRSANDEVADDDAETPLLPMVSSHKLRKTFATNCCAEGIPLETTKALLGHKDISVTANVYVQARRDILADASRKLELAMYRQGMITDDTNEQLTNK
jgi:integrase